VLGTTRRHTDAVRLRLLDYIDGLADLSAGSISLHGQIREQTGGQGVNVVFDVVGVRCLRLVCSASHWGAGRWR
jgi:NADPH:quinone reductase-like Zn-dependent oxidoreductase